MIHSQQFQLEFIFEAQGKVVKSYCLKPLTLKNQLEALAEVEALNDKQTALSDAAKNSLTTLIFFKKQMVFFTEDGQEIQLDENELFEHLAEADFNLITIRIDKFSGKSESDAE